FSDGALRQIVEVLVLALLVVELVFVQVLVVERLDLVDLVHALRRRGRLRALVLVPVLVHYRGLLVGIGTRQRPTPSRNRMIKRLAGTPSIHSSRYGSTPPPCSRRRAPPFHLL